MPKRCLTGSSHQRLKSEDLTSSHGGWGAMLGDDDGWFDDGIFRSWSQRVAESLKSTLYWFYVQLFLGIDVLYRDVHGNVVISSQEVFRAVAGVKKESEAVALQPTALCRRYSRWSRNHVSHKADDSTCPSGKLFSDTVATCLDLPILKKGIRMCSGPLHFWHSVSSGK